MAIVLLHTINSGYTREKAIINYMKWANNNYPKCKGNSPFMGNNTRKLFVAGRPDVKLYNNRFKKCFPSDINKENAQSNGPLMRAYSFAFIDDDSYIKEDVYITNPNDLCYNAVVTYVKAIKMAIINKTKQEIKVEIRKLIKHELLLTAFDQACTNTFRDVTKNRGHIIHSYYCAFWGLFQFDDYKSAIDSIICLTSKPNEKAIIYKSGTYKKKDVIIGDTDTNAAIAGALIGAYYGLRMISKIIQLKKT